MLGKVTMAVLVASVSCALAEVDPNTPVNGVLQQQFLCPQKDCKTQCVGPGGPQTITGYRNLSAYMFSQPDRLWLDLDDIAMIILGVGDRCTFAGAPLKVKIAPGGSSLFGPNPQQCNCIGNQCIPEGCASGTAPASVPTHSNLGPPPAPSTICIGNQCPH